MNTPVSSQIIAIQKRIANTPDVMFAVLVGSRANDTHTDQSDWDIAALWRHGPALDRIGKHELLRHDLARHLAIPDDKVDLIDLSNTRLAMQAVVVEEGQLVWANDALAWAKYQVRVWRELEDYYWKKAHAA